jgi:putative membrane-bound dehydrogenase-like protein
MFNLLQPACRCRGRLLLFLALALVALSLPTARAARGIPQAEDAPRPLSPQESRKTFRLPEGFRIELVAAEPHLAEPTGLCFDARGRLFVSELHGYNLDGYYDILELNKTGVLDTQVRRIPASKAAEERAARETYGTVKLLEDTDGDGKVDRSTVFADHLPPCYGVVAARDGVIAICAPDIVFLADRDGDGKAEVKETLFTGFGVGEIWTRISNPRWGLDNWIYVAAGQGSRGTIRGPHLKEPVQLGDTCFRFKPDGSRLEPVSGGTSGFGLAFDDWGHRFLCTNQQHALFVAPLPYKDLARNPYQVGVNPVVNISGYGHPAKLFPASKPDPWRRKRGERPEWVKFYGAAETDAGMFTSACSPLIYRADLFPEANRGSHFSCEPAQNLIHRCLLEPQSTRFTARRAEEGKEFLTSIDGWFRPVNLVVGPEGALYVVDMYREIIEDYSAIPRYLQQQYVESLANGRTRGRIWRILAGRPRKTDRADFSRYSSAELVTGLKSGNAERRLTAQRLLVERGDKKAGAALEKLCRDGPTPQARLHALYTLDGLGQLDTGLIEHALGDVHFAVRVHALRLAQPLFGEKPSLLARAVKLADDSAPWVRLQLAFSLGDCKDRRALPALAGLARRDGSDPWMQTALLSAVPTRAALLVEHLLHDTSAGGSEPLLHPLAAVVGARNDPEEVACLLSLAADLKGSQGAVQQKLLEGLAEGLSRGGSRKVLVSAGQKALERLLASPSVEIRQRVLRIAGQVRMADTRVIDTVRAAALRTALDADRPLAERQASLAMLKGASLEQLKPLADLLGARQPVELQLAVAGLLGGVESARVVPLVLGHWEECSPQVQQAVIEILCSRQDRLGLLLDAIEKKTIEAASLPPLRQNQLLDNPDDALRRRARALLSTRSTSAERKAVLQRYQASLKLKRDPVRGKVVFEQQCLKCHQLGGQGFAVGPDLAAVQNRPDESLLIDILDPSSTITAGYKSYTVLTESGKFYSGTLAAETATSITLRREKGEQDVILRKDIDRMSALSKSLMPDGLEKEISPQDMANLVGYLREALRTPARTRVLFDDEEDFVKKLNEGDGQAALTAEAPFSGKACLRVTPPQRFSARIPGWAYRIVEKPGPGEYRYLRFVWKSPTGTGVMLELADNGSWPAADSSRGRLYSGKNTSGWGAVRISAEPPRQWAVVTVDLWKHFGAFTLTGIAPTAMGGPAFFDRIELLPTLEAPADKR